MLLASISIGLYVVTPVRRGGKIANSIMATYKVIQDIEAEDKFVGPLTLKQFIFAATGVLCGYLSFFAVLKGAYFMLVFLLPPAFLGFFLAIPWSKDQPTEIWVLAKLRFHFKPRKRVWNQDGIQELVTITAPKKVEHLYTNNLSQGEVKSRLRALADTIDTRGWAVKTPGAVHTPTPSLISRTDRLVDTTILPQQVATLNDDTPDPMDEKNSPVASNFSRMIQTSQEDRRAEALEMMEEARKPKTVTARPVTKTTPAVQHLTAQPATATPVTTTDEKLLSEQLKKSSSKGEDAVGHMHAIPTRTTAQTTQPKTDQKKAQAPIPSTPRTDILDLSQNNDLNVATIARQAKRDEPSDEVVISLR